jgi:hypothetical protein
MAAMAVQPSILQYLILNLKVTDQQTIVKLFYIHVADKFPTILHHKCVSGIFEHCYIMPALLEQISATYTSLRPATLHNLRRKN